MALKRLTTDEMIQLSGAWVPGGAAHAVIAAQPELSALAARIEAARNELIGLQPLPNDPRLAALSKEAAEVDLRHDAVVRGIHEILSSLAMLSTDEARTEALLRARDALLPEGIEATQRTYRAQAGAVERLRARLESDASLRAELDRQSVGGRPLSAYVAEWIATGQRLGEIEAERAALSGPTGPSVGAREVAARNQWIRIVNVLIANAALAGVEGEADTQLFAALRIAERNADRRGRARGGKSPSPGPDGQPTV